MGRQHHKSVRCYFCGEPFAVSDLARSAPCPRCSRGLVLDDLHVRDASWGGRYSTCGRIFIGPKAHAVTREVHAGDGIEVLGTLEAGVRSNGPIVLGNKANVRGEEVAATSLWIDPGGRLECGMLRIGPARSTPIATPAQPPQRVQSQW